MAEKQIEAITGTDDLAEAIKDTIYIQESVPENLKQKVLTQIMEHTTSDDVMFRFISIENVKLNYEFYFGETLLVKGLV